MFATVHLTEDIFVPGGKSSELPAARTRVMNIKLASSICHFSRKIGKFPVCTMRGQTFLQNAASISFLAAKARWQ